ncbi:MAG UNVERIFIED_CONTAM: hypothetical protein LVR18_51220 [Planctomycetaceae bacterium]
MTMYPVVHGSGDSAVEVRRLMLSHKFDCLAVPLPASFQSEVESAVELLPRISVVLQREPHVSFLPHSDYRGESNDSSSTDGDDDGSDDLQPVSFVPIDPCQPVIAGLRIARQERMARAFIDIETEDYLPSSTAAA